MIWQGFAVAPLTLCCVVEVEARKFFFSDASPSDPCAPLLRIGFVLGSPRVL